MYACGGREGKFGLKEEAKRRERQGGDITEEGNWECEDERRMWGEGNT